MPPIYTYVCQECKITGDSYRKVIDRHKAPACHCGGVTVLRITPATVVPDVPEYISPVTGKPVRGRKERQEDLLRTGCRPYEGSEQEDKEAARWQAYEKAKADEKLEQQAHEVFNGLPAAAQRALEGL